MLRLDGAGDVGTGPRRWCKREALTLATVIEAEPSYGKGWITSDGLILRARSAKGPCRHSILL